ncbi:MAG: NAD-dependent dehydratase [Rickettsiales bacterium]|nr:NAD-dependent dehydratase [Rickettsiales bacterium]|tara:strand:- start:4508 stop:5494 length:987 start_codon:yes stop_codon:yes gene_type:complete
MKIFITGADGFIGSHLTEKLLNKGYKVTALSYYNSFGFTGWLNDVGKNKNLRIIHGDIRDSNFLEKAIKGHQIVFHLAALISIPHSYESYSSFIHTNVIGTTNVLAAVKKNKIRKTIVTSTSEVYGSAQYVPINEKHPLNAQSPYAASKISADQLSMSFYKSFNIPLTIIRPFNTFGPRQSTRAIIPTIITQILKEKDIKLGNTSTIRDFTFYKDTVEGFIKCISKKGIIGQTINISSGYEISINNVIKVIKNLTKYKKKIRRENKRIRPIKSEVNRLWGCNKKAKKLLNWKPNYSGAVGFKKGIYETIQWYKKEENLKKFDPNQFNI